ncbi:rho guanyl nucleotide exchange factor [Lichtheimia corymbifera JMRC:FSU:9682]|uniref:Rho guanyl nucleotide exchange factor n=1 Tax=Lichtheimia corymbifera JMRC:FSU:9682 TaxID=1263082 RepID=A0A068RKP8_9FUNG|nr:rho guanyl nucleotide exchange factor [Lichtheimia corymbifera JMRC:FSU:9682]
MTSPDAHLLPAIAEPDNVQEETLDYSQQGPHAIHRKSRTPSPTMPVQEMPFGARMPEAIRKSYVQQRLPVRQQSLAAPYNRKSLLPFPPTQQQQQQRSSSAAASYRSTSHMRPSTGGKVKVPPIRTSSIIHLNSVYPNTPISTLPSNNKETEEEEDDDFDFQDRPPSSIVCVVPTTNHDNNSELFSPDTPNDLHHQLSSSISLPSDIPGLAASPSTHPPPPSSTLQPSTDDDILLSPETSNHGFTRRGSEAVSIDTCTTADYTPNNDSVVADQAFPRMKHSRSDSNVTLGRRDTMSTLGDFDTELPPMSPSVSDDHSRQGSSSSRQSIFLRMQQKREEQRRSIYAYRASNARQQHQQPMVYPAMLSLVARELYRRLSIRTIRKNDIEHHNVFEGKEAVDRLLLILRTHDRNLALLVGRALDAQNFLHDVNYEHRLRDSPDELYRFREEIGIPMGLEGNDGDHKRDMDDYNVPTGVFTVLTDCYSPTCSRDKLCYSATCPRKASKGLRRTQSQSSLQEKEHRALWMHSVPQEILDTTPAQERKRQECIYELIHTEQDFVRDLQYVHNFWVKPLITEDIIPDERREHFVQEVFWNMADIEKVNSRLSRALIERQKEDHLVSRIGDVLLEYVCEFDPFVAYGAHQVIGKFNFELEKKRNPQFAQFVEDTERKPESRRLELNGYLTKPTTRLGRYNLLLREILKRTEPDNPDYELIPQIMEMISEYLIQVNTETGKCENIFNLQQIEERLSFKTHADYVDLKLREPGRELVMKGRLRRKGNTLSDSSDLQVFLFDHYLVFAKIKYYNHMEYYKVYRKPIPLELLSIQVSGMKDRNKRTSVILPYSRSATLLSNHNSISPKPSASEIGISSSKSGNHSITFYHHGRRGSPPLTLYTSSLSTQKAWIEKVKAQQAIIAENRRVFVLKPLVQGSFTLSNKIHSSAILREANGDRQIIVGSDQGVYSCKYPKETRQEVDEVDEQDDEEDTVKRIMSVEKVYQVGIVDNGELLVLSDKTLWAFPIDMVKAGELQAKRTRPLSQHCAFFHIGESMGKTLVCVVKLSALTPTTIRVLEPVAVEEDKKSKRTFIQRLVRPGSENLRPYKDLYLPSEASAISLLKTKMCVSCPQEIGVIDMKSFEVQALLDPDDEELAFVFSRQDLRPISIYRIQFAEYLVCYNEFAFFVDQRGRLKRSRCTIEWEGMPDSFALCYPYIIAFEPEFIEVRNILTGSLDQFIRGTHIRCVNPNANGSIHVAMSDTEHEGYQGLFQLKMTKRHVDYLPPSSSYLSTMW